MSDELMRQIQESLDAAYKRGFDEGWYDGNAAAWGSLAEWATKQEAAARNAPGPSPQDEAEYSPEPHQALSDPVDDLTLDGPAQEAPTEHRLTPAQQRALDYVRENPGLKSRQLEGIGKGTLYGLVRSGVLSKRGQQFYASEPA